jgi:uncharacterized protein (DUF58 family)
MIQSELLQKVRRIQIRTSRLVSEGFVGSYNSAFKGRGMQFEDVREYQPGDDVRAIDWNVTARMDSPYVKNFREERELTVTLVVDVSPSVLFGTVSREKREWMAELASVLSLSAFRSSDKVSLLLFTDEVEVYLPPKRGISHLMQVIRELLVYQPTGKRTDLGSALQFLAKMRRRRGVCFLLSDFLSALPARDISLAARRFDLVSLCVTDPREILFPNLGLLRLKDLETGAARLIDTGQQSVRERLENHSMAKIDEARGVVQQAGGSFVDLRTDEDYLPALRRCFEMRELRRC